MLLALKNVRKSYGENVIIDDAAFLIEEKEKVAIVGVNGAGKTTLFKILTKEIQADGGEVVLQKDAKIGYLSQMSDLNCENTINEEMLTVFSDIINLEANMRELEHEMSVISGDELSAAMEKYSRLTARFEQINGYEYKSRLRGVVSGLGFFEAEENQKIGTFSGGQKTRISLAKLLLTSPDILLLDEPTNHLDISSIEWLEEFLKTYEKSVIIISHDRYFVDKIVTKVVEIENKKSSVYSGNFSAYYEKKLINREIELKHYENQQKEIKRQEQVIKLLKSYNREKTVKRAESREKMLDKMEKVDKPENLPKNIRFGFKPKNESGNDVLRVEGVKKSFSDKTLFNFVGFNVYKGEKIALIGPNGIGKTTFLRILLGTLEKDAGDIMFGAGVNTSYYDQEHQNIDMEKTIFDEIYDSYPLLTVLEIRSALAAFVFTADDVFKQIKTLSGGERGRVALAKIMLSNANFLILDEPTNHLDIFSKEILENALKNYKGTILYVSHDRYFINQTATKVVELKADGAEVFEGDYEYYLERRSVFDQKDQKIETSDMKNEWQKKKENLGALKKSKSLLLKTEKEIGRLEEVIKDLEKMLELPEINTNFEKLPEIFAKREDAEKKLENLYETWDSLVSSCL